MDFYIIVNQLKLFFDVLRTIKYPYFFSSKINQMSIEAQNILARIHTATILPTPTKINTTESYERTLIHKCHRSLPLPHLH